MATAFPMATALLLLSLGTTAAVAGPDRPVVLFVYFTSRSENLHMAYSRDGLQFTALNGPRTGRNQPPCPNCTTPVLTLPGCHASGCPSLGPSVRDPFINRAPDGRTFHVVATSGGFGPSRQIHYWNLTLDGSPRWSNHSLLHVMAGVNTSGPRGNNHPSTGTADQLCSGVQAWAPEFIWDPMREEYLIFFSSTTRDSADDGLKWIWGVWTKDFAALSKPFVVFKQICDPGKDGKALQCGGKQSLHPYPGWLPGHEGQDTIDGTMHRLNNGSVLFFFKDERGPVLLPGGTQRPRKAVRQVLAARGLSGYHTVCTFLGCHNESQFFDTAGVSGPRPPWNSTATTQPFDSPPMTEGPELLEFQTAWGKYLLFYDCFTTEYYGVSASHSLEPGSFKPIPGSSCTAEGPTVRFPQAGTEDNPRHGSFVTISEAELAVLLTEYKPSKHTDLTM